MLGPEHGQEIEDVGIQPCAGASQQEVLPLYHISGTDNPADLLTKPKTLTEEDLLADSVWHKGPDWMRLPTAELPDVQFITLPPELEEPYNQEIFQEVVVGTANAGEEERDDQNTVACQSVPATPPRPPQANSIQTPGLHLRSSSNSWAGPGQGQNWFWYFKHVPSSATICIPCTRTTWQSATCVVKTVLF